jgi:uncharacterized membrane protein
MDATTASVGNRQTSRNIQTIAKLEEAAQRQRRITDRASDVIVRFAGSVWFVVAHVMWFGVWIVLNTSPMRRFDAYPFGLLNLAVSLEAIVLTTFVLISQNNLTKLADRRAHLDLQINLLAEAEMTLVLNRLGMLCAHLGLPINEEDEAKDLSEPTDIQELAEAVENIGSSRSGLP